MTIQLANHGDVAIHINSISVGADGAWFLIGRFVPPGEVFTYKMNVRGEPVYFRLETSEGLRRFDLSPAEGVH